MFVVCNNRDQKPLNLRKGLALGYNEPSPKVWILCSYGFGYIGLLGRFPTEHLI